MTVRLQYAESELELSDGVFVIGRSPSCDLALHDPLVSRRHARLLIEGSRIVLEDLGSSNGVFVNDIRAHAPTEVHPGDRIGLARVELTLVADDVTEARAKRPTNRPPGGVDNSEETRLIPDQLRALSPRELEVFALLAHGYTHKEAANRMGISNKTVDAYRANIVAKLELRSRAEIVRLALETGVLGSEVASTSLGGD